MVTLSKRGRVTSWSASDAIAYYRDLIDGFSPHFLKSKRRAFCLHNVPTMHPTIKRKCYKNDLCFVKNGGVILPDGFPHTCEKVGHSCMRNIVSFSGFVHKKIFRSVARALSDINRSLVDTWSVGNLAEAPCKIRQRVAKLIKSPTSCCLCCQKYLNEPSMRTFDVPQAYEEVGHKALLSNIRFLMRLAEKTNTGLRQVFHAARAIVSVTRSLHKQRSDSVVLASRTIERCIIMYLKCNLFRIGDTFVEQNGGIPSGGVLSSAFLNAHLGCGEHHASRFAWRKLLPHLVHLEFEHIIATCRYEDDLVALWLCLYESCLDYVILELYKSIIKIEESNDHLAVSREDSVVSVYQKFLDIRLIFNFEGVQFDLFHHNLHVALGYESDTHTRFRFPPPIGCVDTILKGYK